MLTDYIQALMRRAAYEILPEDRSYYGEIPDAPGVYATGATLEACREELREVLEGWVLLSISKHLPLPVVDGMDLRTRQASDERMSVAAGLNRCSTPSAGPEAAGAAHP